MSKLKVFISSNPFSADGSLKSGFTSKDVGESKDLVFKDSSLVVMPNKVVRDDRIVYKQWAAGMFHRVVRSKLGLTRKEMAKVIGISDDLAKKVENGKRRLKMPHKKLLSIELKHHYNNEFLGGKSEKRG